jgi:hypothetical protein
VTRTLNIRNVEIVICEIMERSEPSNQVLIGGLLFSLRVNSPVMNLLEKWTHYCESVGVLVARIIVFRLPKEKGS